MDKRQTVIESIQKLISLGVSDEEIIENLYDVGIEKGDAVSLISEAKGGVKTVEEEADSLQENQQESVSTEPSPVQKPKRVFDKEVNSLTMNEQIVDQISMDKQKKPVVEKETRAVPLVEKKPVVVVREKKEPIGKKPQEIYVEKDSVEEDEDEFEDKVKSNLSSSGKSVVERTFNEKPSEVVVQKSFSKGNESRQNIGFDSSPDFEELWKKGIVVAVNAKLSEMKRLKSDIDSEIQQKVDESMRKELYQFKVLLDSQKELIISSNREALEQKQKEISFIIDAKIAELKQYNKQLSDTMARLDAEKKQQEISIQQINQALEEAKRTKAQLIVEVNSEMIKTKSQAQEFVDNASRHLDEMDAKINKTLELERNIAEGLVEQAEQKIEQLAISRADELIASLEVELNRIQTVSKKISPESLEQKINVLDQFKKDFLNSMQENLTQINVAIDEINKRSIDAERELDEKTLAIDAKLEELTKFEKKFIDKMEKSVKKK